MRNSCLQPTAARGEKFCHTALFEGAVALHHTTANDHSIALIADDPKVVYQDEHLLVLSKPANMLSVPGKGPEKQDCAIARAQRQWPDALSVHRLDYATSGLLVVALGKAVHRSLSKLFEQRQVQKAYVAVVAGLVEQNYGEINLPLICDWPNRPLQKVDPVHGKPALTQYRVLERDSARDTTRVQFVPITGRSHQLRVHAQQLGHPILGDDFYAPVAVRDLSPRLLLHAEHIQFTHPITGQTVTVNELAAF